MFTGLIEEVGQVVSSLPRGSMTDISIRAKTVLEGTGIGDSIAVNGVCQTVTALGGSTFTVQAVEETLRRSTLGSLKRGSPVNLERSLRFGERLGGHLVLGHVDGMGRITRVSGDDRNRLISVAPPRELARLIAEKGSITIDGISLTVTHADDKEFGVSVIPHTLGATTLAGIRPGDFVNLEADVIARYVERILGSRSEMSLSELEGMGF
ncbi:MAG: riboflavin synthase [Candidatus Latescibacterota bacterium]